MVQKLFGRSALGMVMRPYPFVTEELKFYRSSHFEAALLHCLNTVLQPSALD
jgi:hypothetical protein